MSDDLVAFLNARLDEDEQVARAAIGTEGETKSWTEIITAEAAREQAHNERYSPARVLAEVDAKRRILERYTSAVEDAAEDAEGYYDENRFEDARQLVPVLRLLALPYRDHPGYRPEWAPQS